LDRAILRAIARILSFLRQPIPLRRSLPIKQLSLRLSSPNRFSGPSMKWVRSQAESVFHFGSMAVFFYILFVNAIINST
jgi:hypothetical protein